MTAFGREFFHKVDFLCDNDSVIAVFYKGKIRVLGYQDPVHHIKMLLWNREEAALFCSWIGEDEIIFAVYFFCLIPELFSSSDIGESCSCP